MNCPKCKKEMIVKNKDESQSKDGKKYGRTLYWCDIDDIWVNVEIPKK
jgi:hypothetical protein